MFYLLENEV